MASQVDICNLALQLVGDRAIVAIDEDSEQARACNVLYEPTRLELLRGSLWRFSRKRASLAASTTNPTWGYEKAFPKPADCLQVVAIDGGRFASGGVRWSVEGDNIVANTGAPLNILYASDVTDSGKFDPSFVMMFAHQLAVYLCEPRTQSASKKQSLQGELARVFAGAVAADAVESLEAIEADGHWITNRFYTGGTVDTTLVWDAWGW